MKSHHHPKQFNLRFAITGVAIALLTPSILISSSCDRLQAQIIPDRSLSEEASVVTPNVEIKGLLGDRIDGGAIRDSNLFHSFQEFNIGDLQRVYFANPAGITNIFSRVTGSNLSEIFGTLGVNGSANLFLLNPNGIIFGENASLDLGGSFVASTADAIQFGERGFFSATEPEQPPLLTVKPSAFFFNQINLGQIENRSTAPAGVDLSGEPLSGLRVPDGKSLLLLGGDIVIDGGGFHAPGGQLELAGVAGDGIVGLNIDGNNLSLRFPEGVARADVTFTNAADVNVRGADGGSITVNGRNIELSGGEFGVSALRAGIAPASGSTEAQAGDITLNASDTISMSQGSGIDNEVAPTGVGNSGGIEITTANLSLTQGSQVSTSTLGLGNAGSVIIHADTVSFDESFAFSQVEGTGKSSGIEITTDSLSVTNGAQISASTLGLGDAGSITINASKTVSFDGASPNGLSSSVVSDVWLDAQGNGGNIEITTSSLSVTNGAQISASTLGRGNAGSVKLDARDTVSFDGFNEQFPIGISAVFANVESGAVGKGGNIDITAGSLLMTNSAQLIADTNGQGNAGSVRIDVRDTVSLDGVGSNGLSSAVFSSIGVGGVGKGGNIDIIADSLLITNGAELIISNLGQGDAGDVTIHARSIVFLDGVGSNGFPSAVFSSVAEDPAGSVENPIGNGGDIHITTELLTVTNGARLAADTLVGKGDAGRITIKAREVSFDGVGSDGPSGAFSAVGSEAVGNGVGINITAESLSLKNGALLSSSTRGQGDGGNIILNTNTLEALNGGQVITTSFSSGKAGNITLNVTDSVTLAGSDPTFFDRLAQFDEDVEDVVIGVGPNSGLFANTEFSSTGNGGDIFIDPKTVLIRDGAQIAVDSQGTGTGGEISLQADYLTLDNNASISAETASNTGGDIALKIQDLLLLRRGSNISATAGLAQGEGDGGNIMLDTPLLVAIPQENSDITANAFEGKGGNINIDTENIFGFELQENPNLSDITASSEFGFDGTVNINTSGLEPGQESIALPIEIVDVSKLIDRNLCLAGQEGEFIITGKGGLSPSPKDPLNTDAGWEDWRIIEDNQRNNQQATAPRKEVTPKNRDNFPTIIEAQGWYKAPNGNIVLTAQPTTVQSQDSWLDPFDCRLLREVN